MSYHPLSQRVTGCAQKTGYFNVTSARNGMQRRSELRRILSRAIIGATELLAKCDYHCACAVEGIPVRLETDGRCRASVMGCFRSCFYVDETRDLLTQQLFRGRFDPAIISGVND